MLLSSDDKHAREALRPVRIRQLAVRVWPRDDAARDEHLPDRADGFGVGVHTAGRVGHRPSGLPVRVVGPRASVHEDAAADGG